MLQLIAEACGESAKICAISALVILCVFWSGARAQRAISVQICSMVIPRRTMEPRVKTWTLKIVEVTTLARLMIENHDCGFEFAN